MISLGREVRLSCTPFNLATSRRSTDVCYCTTSGPYTGGPLAIEHENLVKSYAVLPTILGRGHAVSETRGPIWVR